MTSGRIGTRVRKGTSVLVGALVLTLGGALLSGCITRPGKWLVRAPASFARQEVSYVYSPTVKKFFLSAGSSTVQEAYDPSTNRWTRVAPLPARLNHIQAVELNGRIYYIGGLITWPGPAVGTVFVYNPVTNTFAKGKPMLRGRERGAGGVAVHGNKIYYAGGLHNGYAVPWFDVYDTVANSWAKLPDMAEARDHFQAAVVGNRFYAIGGRKTAINATIRVNDAFDFATGSWVTALKPLPTARGGFAVGVLGTQIFVIGGEGDGHTFSTVEQYDTTANKWHRLTPIPVGRHGIEAAMCNGGIYVAGGGTRQGGGAPTAAQQVWFPGAPHSCP
jgi:N-acetylneuraminic acid mutarotase